MGTMQATKCAIYDCHSAQEDRGDSSPARNLCRWHGDVTALIMTTVTQDKPKLATVMSGKCHCDDPTCRVKSKVRTMRALRKKVLETASSDARFELIKWRMATWRSADFVAFGMLCAAPIDYNKMMENLEEEKEAGEVDDGEYLSRANFCGTLHRLMTYAK